jgi:N-acetylmuramoyl-L-alanine amidase/putative methionine-R-sulfoxide reductase with GAF domain
MGTIPAKAEIASTLGDQPGSRLGTAQASSWPVEGGFASPQHGLSEAASQGIPQSHPTGRDALQALLAFSALHQQVRQRRALAAGNGGFEGTAKPSEFEAGEQFVLDEVLQLIAERAVAITGANGLGIALAENNEIVLRASAGTIKPDVGARIQRDSAFSGACFRLAQIIRCDDTETDDRVNLYACRQLGARSIVAVPLCGRRRVIGLLEAFSVEPFGFNDSDVRSLDLLAELIVGALKPEDEDRFAQSAQVAETTLAAPAFPSPEPAAHEEASSTLDEKASSADATASEIPSRVHEQHETEASPASAEPVPVAPSLAEAAQPAAEAVSEESLQTKALSVHHPGIVLVVVLVIASAMLAAGIWWKLKNGRFDSLVVQSERTTKAGASAKTPAASASSSLTAPIPPNLAGSTNGQTKPGANAGGLGQSSTGTENLSPQDLLKLPRVTGIRHWSSEDSSTVVLDLQDQVQYEAHRLAKPDRIYFDLHDTSLAPELENKIIDVGDALISRVRVAQPSPGLTRVVLETKGNSNFSVSLEPNPYRLVVEVSKLGASPKAQINLFPGAEAEKLAIVVPPPTKEDLQLRARVPKMRIVVDAGHGGWDLGTVGRGGLLEKDLVLEIAQRLGKLLESRLGAEVLLTRNDDNYIPLDERASIANQAQADLFVSVHANYSDLPSARGVETYYTNLFRAPDAKELETRSGIGSKDFATASLSVADLHEKIEQSRRLAVSVQHSLYGTLATQNPGLRDRGVKEASYVVLTETAMPGILAEVSFVSSPTDERRLQNDGYREQIAEALYKGIARYAAFSRGVKMASAAK